MKTEKLLDSHLESCARIYVDTFNSEPWNDKWDMTSAYNRLKDIFDTPGFCGLVLTEKEDVLAAVFGNHEHWFEGSMYNLKEMFVRKDIKNKGLGSKLMNAIEKEVKQEGANSITLFTTRGDLTESFYVRNGFETEEDMIMMCKSI